MTHSFCSRAIRHVNKKKRKEKKRKKRKKRKKKKKRRKKKHISQDSFLTYYYTAINFLDGISRRVTKFIGNVSIVWPSVLIEPIS